MIDQGVVVYYMNKLDFTLELKSQDLPKKIEYALFAKADDRLQRLREDHTDMTGAVVTVHALGHAETLYLYEVTVVVYGRPAHVVATQKEESPMTALIEALNAVERQIRQRREKLSKPWEQLGNLPVEEQEMMISETVVESTFG